MNEIGYVGWLERNFLFVFLLLLIRTKSVENKETEGNGPSDVIYHG